MRGGAVAAAASRAGGSKDTSYCRITALSCALDAADDAVRAAVRVANVGSRAGAEVVLLYSQPPYSDFDRAMGRRIPFSRYWSLARRNASLPKKMQV